MAKITPKDYERCYCLWLDVNQGKIAFSDAVAEAAKHGMNATSASNLIDNLRRMLAGKVYKRTMSADATDHYLRMMRQDFGATALESALRALEGHIIYYEGLQSVTLKKQRSIWANYTNRVHPE